jgi:glycosyltransferase involved in cell wall biosynthesis
VFFLFGFNETLNRINCPRGQVMRPSYSNTSTLTEYHEASSMSGLLDPTQHNALKKDRLHLAYLTEGNSYYDRFFLQRLSERYDITVLTFNLDPYEIPDHIRTITIRCGPFRVPRSWVLAWLRAYLLRKKLDRIRPNIVVSNWALAYGFYAALSGFKPNILFVWGSDVLVWPDKSRFLESVVRYAIRKADAMLMDCKALATRCIRLGALSNKILILPWFDVRDVLKQRISQEDKTRLREELGICNDEIVVVSTRSHSPLYSVRTLVEAIPKVLSAAPDTRFLIVGDGPETSLLKDMVQRSKVGPRTVFTGRVERPSVLRLLQVSDIYVSTSLSDGTSSSLLEAMTLGVPVIVTDLPANREWVVHGSSGMLFPPGDSVALSKTITDLAGNEASRHCLAREALDTVIAKADWERNSKLLYETMEALTGERSREAL